MENPDLFYCTLTALTRKSLIINGAGEGNRTLVSGLGSPHSTIEPHPGGHRHNSYQIVIEAARPEFLSFNSSAEEKQFEPRNTRNTESRMKRRRRPIYLMGRGRRATSQLPKPILRALVALV